MQRYGTQDSEFQFGGEEEEREGYLLYVSGPWNRQKGIDWVLELARLHPQQRFKVYGNEDVRSTLTATT